MLNVKVSFSLIVMLKLQYYFSTDFSCVSLF